MVTVNYEIKKKRKTIVAEVFKQVFSVLQSLKALDKFYLLSNLIKPRSFLYSPVCIVKYVYQLN